MKVQREDDQHLWVRCTNPKHEDSTASMCINKTDSGCYPIGFAYCYSCSYTMRFSKEAVREMSKQKSIARKKVPVDWVELNKQFISRDKKEQRSKFLAADWGIFDLRRFEVGWDGEAFTFPMRDEGLNICGIMRRFPNSSKKCIHGSHLGLFFPLNGPLNLFSDLVICEGLSDAVIATEIGFNGIGKSSAGFGEQIIRKLLENEKYKGKVIICRDNDPAGLLSSVKLVEALKNWEIKVVVPEEDLKSEYLKYGKGHTLSLLEK